MSTDALFEFPTDNPAQPVFATEWAVRRALGAVLNFGDDEDGARHRLEKGGVLLQRTVLIGPWSVVA